tara:strand:+ start:356 stop:1054 length:699 start_codon:yes stop_codon:yes gene_type:complete
MFFKYSYKLIITVTFFSLSLYAQNKKEREVLNFIHARYNGNIDSVKMFLHEEFTYFHSPYIGMGMTTEERPEGIFVDKVSPFIKATIKPKVNDIIVEVNNIKVEMNKNYDIIKRNINGALGDSIEFLFLRNDTTFNSKIFLTEQQFKQNSISFLTDIKLYADRWYEYDFDLKDIISKKNKFVVHYEWEGSLMEGGQIYSFKAIEIIKTSSRNNKIVSIEAVWTEKQFIDQFR